MVHTFNAIVAANQVHDCVTASLISFRREDLSNLGEATM